MNVLSRLRLRTPRCLHDTGSFLLDNVSGVDYYLCIRQTTKGHLMKLMITNTVVGIGLLGLGYVMGSTEITVNPMKVLWLTAAVLFVVGGVAGIVYAWQNRGMRFRRTRKGRRA
jgi:hypothetical protein